MGVDDGGKSLQELMAMGVTVVMEGDLYSGRKFNLKLKDSTEVEAKIVGKLVDGRYLVWYKLGDEELGRAFSEDELTELI